MPSLNLFPGVLLTRRLTGVAKLYSHAALTFANRCIGNIGYEGTVSAIFMAGLFLSFLVDYLGQVILRSNAAKASHSQTRETVSLYVLEAGILFHSMSTEALPLAPVLLPYSESSPRLTSSRSWA